MICPACRVEYRPGFTQCADCRVPLVQELPPEERVKELPPHDDQIAAVCEEIRRASGRVVRIILLSAAVLFLSGVILITYHHWGWVGQILGRVAWQVG